MGNEAAAIIGRIVEKPDSHGDGDIRVINAQLQRLIGPPVTIDPSPYPRDSITETDPPLSIRFPVVIIHPIYVNPLTRIMTDTLRRNGRTR